MNVLLKFPSRLALIAALSAAPVAVYAQTADQPGDDTMGGTAQGEAASQTQGDAASQGQGDAASQGQGMSQDMTADAPAEEKAEPVEGQIEMQSEDTILANNLIGSSIYSQEGESIGKVDNMIINLDGSVEGIVIGVGGFLGIGKKSVAIEMNSLSVDQDEEGNPRLETSATKTDLEAAEAFVTQSEQKAEERAQDMQQDSMGSSSMGTPSTQEGQAPAAEQ